MHIDGYRIQILRTPAEPRATVQPAAAGRTAKADSADVARLAWVVMNQECEPAAVDGLERAVAESRYWIPAPQISSSLIEDHLFVRA